MTNYDPRRPTRPATTGLGGGWGAGWIIAVIMILVIIGFGWGGWYGGWYGGWTAAGHTLRRTLGPANATATPRPTSPHRNTNANNTARATQPIPGASRLRPCAGRSRRRRPATARPRSTARSTSRARAHRPKATAISAAPNDWPISRPDDCSPEAPPLRSGGALPMMSRLFGDWKNPKPRPQTASRQTSEAGPALPPSSATSARPGRHDHKPGAAEQAGTNRSASRPAIGAMTAPWRAARASSGGRSRSPSDAACPRRRTAAPRGRGSGRRRRRSTSRATARTPAGQEIERQQGRRQPELPSDEHDAERRGAGELRDRDRLSASLADAVDPGDEQAEGQRVEGHADRIELRSAPGVAGRFRAAIDERDDPDRDVDEEKPPPGGDRQDRRRDAGARRPSTPRR